MVVYLAGRIKVVRPSFRGARSVKCGILRRDLHGVDSLMRNYRPIGASWSKADINRTESVENDRWRK
jgi:hypothetical protein